MVAARQVLVLDDDPDICQFIALVASSMQCECQAITRGADFLDALRPDISLIFLDLLMPDLDGIEVLRLLGKRQCRAGIILVSGVDKRILDSAVELAQTLGLQVAGYLHKPFQLAEIVGLLKPPVLQAAAPCHAAGVTEVFSAAVLQQALAREEFVVYYQPQIDFRSRELVGLEALVRWQHPERGLLAPDAFIGQFEALGLIDQLGWQVARHALADLGEFVELNNALTLSLNVSAKTLHNLQFPDQLVALAQEYHIPPNCLTIEITESGLIQELSTALDILTRLRMKGVNLSIDDFGTGYAMMQQLQLVPATELKVDKSFVHEMLHNDTSCIIVQKTIEMGHALGMHVVAEGVETMAQFDFLRECKCDISQGYLHSKPMPAAQLPGWMREHDEVAKHHSTSFSH